MARRSDRLFDLVKEGASIRQLQLVVESGVNINAYNERRETPLMTAMLNIHDPVKREEVMKTLISYRANVNCRNLRGQTPLMYACILNQLEVISMLANVSWVNCNLFDKEGNTALMYACALGNTAAVVALFECFQDTEPHGIDVRKPNREGYMAMDYVMENGDVKAYELISAELARTESSGRRKQPSSEAQGPIPEFHDPINSAKRGTNNSRDRLKEIAVTLSSLQQHSLNDVDKGWKSLEDCMSRKETFSKESNIPNKRSVLNVHLPKAVDDYVEGRTTPSETLLQAYTLDEKCSTSNDPTDQTQDETYGESITSKKSKKSKSKGKKSKRKSRGKLSTEESEMFNNDQSFRRDFGEEIMLCNRIYEADPYTFEDNGTPGDPFNQDVARSIITDLTCKAANTFNTADAREKTEQFQNYGKFSFYNLTPQDRAKLLGRTMWSAYKTPLPPIPISKARMEQVIRGIQRLRRFLHVAKYKPGRLLKLDPELWCIVESIKLDLSLKKRA